MYSRTSNITINKRDNSFSFIAKDPAGFIVYQAYVIGKYTEAYFNYMIEILKYSIVKVESNINYRGMVDEIGIDRILNIK